MDTPKRDTLPWFGLVCAAGAIWSFAGTQDAATWAFEVLPLTGILAVSWLPTFSGKGLKTPISRQWAIPLLLLAGIVILLLVSHPFETVSALTLAYVACSLLAGLTGILFTLELNSVQPASTGSFYELYAIAAAVLGGCSLRGGRGAVLSVIAGAAVMRCLYKAIIVLGISQEWEMVIIGAALLAAVATDEAINRWSERPRRPRAAT